MSTGTLYTFSESYRGYLCRIAAAYGNSTLKVVELKSDDKSHPQVPFFESDDKKVSFFEANAIAYYLTNDQFRGVSVEDRTRVYQWLSYAGTQVESAVTSWVYAALGLVDSTPAYVARAKEELKKVFKFLDDALKTRTFLVGERLSLADVSVACHLLLAFEYVADEAFRQPFGNVARWYLTVVNQPQFKTVSGEAKLAVKALEFDAKKHGEMKKKQEKEPKPAKEQVKPAPKEQPKPAPKPAAKPADDDDEDDTPPEPKQDDPFAAMPKGNWNMDEFKRTYSNNDTATVALPYFWKNYEKEFYSLWYCEYKYASELTQLFMSCNLITGMFSRIEKLRKNAFASMGVFGEANNNTIAGVWFWKGQELVFPLCVDWTIDYESFEWRKLNTDDAKDKKLVEDFFKWEVELNGKKFYDGKIFK